MPAAPAEHPEQYRTLPNVATTDPVFLSILGNTRTGFGEISSVVSAWGPRPVTRRAGRESYRTP